MMVQRSALDLWSELPIPRNPLSRNAMIEPKSIGFKNKLIYSSLRDASQQIRVVLGMQHHHPQTPDVMQQAGDIRFILLLQPNGIRK
jgi:hypothetical protein